jgi:hypothetical protein
MAKLDTANRKKIPAKEFAEPDKRAYPIENKAHARNAKARASQAAKAGRMSKAESIAARQLAMQTTSSAEMLALV